MAPNTSLPFFTYRFHPQNLGTEIMILKFEIVDIKTETGRADDYAVMERGDTTGDSAMTILGWDEIGKFDHYFIDPVYVRVTTPTTAGRF
jgi:hypothetical protein